MAIFSEKEQFSDSYVTLDDDVRYQCYQCDMKGTKQYSLIKHINILMVKQYTHVLTAANHTAI